jgi:hypothetical protein
LTSKQNTATTEHSLQPQNKLYPSYCLREICSITESHDPTGTNSPVFPVAAQKHHFTYLLDTHVNHTTENASLNIQVIVFWVVITCSKRNHPILECGEGDHLNSEAGDTAAPSTERLSFIVEMNHHGSLTSLHDRSHRGSSAFELRPHGSASKDLLRSALEANHYQASNPQLNRKNSVGK